MEPQADVLEMKENAGLPNEGFVEDIGEIGKQSGNTEEGPHNVVDALPPLTYNDFIPESLGLLVEGKEPSFEDFETLVEKANKWLLSEPQFTVYKCETITVKLGADHKPNTDQTLVHFSSNGKNCFLRILRVWLLPKADLNLPVQQISYTTVLPDHIGGHLNHFLDYLAEAGTSKSLGKVAFPSFDSLKTTIDKLNNYLQLNPLSGQILSVETVTFKCQESNTSDRLDANCSVWSEGGSNTRMYLHGFRVFYIVGQPTYETIGIYDEVPEMLQKEGLDVKPKFGTFNQTLNKSSQWLQTQQDVRVVGIQTVDVKLERKNVSDAWILDSSAPGYIESQGLTESRYVQVLRIAYATNKKWAHSPLNTTISLTSKLFVPVRIEGKRFETFSKTMLRAIKWHAATCVPLLTCETINYHICAESTGQGFNEQRLDYQINTYQGQYYLTCIRLYFSTSYTEQQPVMSVTRGRDSGWSCSIS